MMTVRKSATDIAEPGGVIIASGKTTVSFSSRNLI